MFFQKYADIILKEQDVSSFSRFCLLYELKQEKGDFFYFLNH